MNWYHRHYNKYVLKNYKESASIVGDMESYSYMGIAVGYQRARDWLALCTKQMRRKGMKDKIMSKQERIKFGGYGEEPGGRR